MSRISSGLRGWLIGLGVAAGVGGFWWFYQVQQSVPNVPVIIYLVDTLRADRIGLYGYTDRDTTPVIDDLATESVVFDQAYAPAPWTLPSVTSLITSTFACEHGLISEEYALDPAQHTLTERLASVGYATLGRYANPYVGPASGLDRGFQRLVETTGAWTEEPAQVETMLSDLVPGKPFYLYVHTVEPHEPFRASTSSVLKFGHVNVDTRQAYGDAHLNYLEALHVGWDNRNAVDTTDNLQKMQKAGEVLVSIRESIDVLYDAAVLQADENLGDLISRLRRLGIWDKAIFIFLSDHGEEFYDHGGWFHGQSVYEELARVPLIIHFPGGEFGGRRVSGSVSLVDIMPTIFDYLDRPDLCPDCRGTSVMPRLRQSEMTEDGGTSILSMRHDDRMFHPDWVGGRGNRNVVVRRGDWKGIWNADSDSVELYDLGPDPVERLDVRDEMPELAEEFQMRAQEWLDVCSANRFSPTEGNELDEETQQKLRALGYFQ